MPGKFAIMKGMRKIGITGTIGAGKSFVSSLLRERGYTFGVVTPMTPQPW